MRVIALLQDAIIWNAQETQEPESVKVSSFLMQDFVGKDEAGFNDIAQNSDGKKDFWKSHYNASTILVFPRSLEMSHILFFPTPLVGGYGCWSNFWVSLSECLTGSSDLKCVCTVSSENMPLVRSLPQEHDGKTGKSNGF